MIEKESISNNKPVLFGTDGIRGTVGTYPLIAEFVVNLGTAAGIVMGKSSSRPLAIVGRDTRQSGQMLQHAITTGLLTTGVTVVDVGVIPTPGVAFLVHKIQAQAGIIISASHNPVDQNGIKIVNSQGSKLTASVEYEIEQLATNPTSLPKKTPERFGRSVNGEMLKELYIDSLLDEHPDLNLDSLKIIVDCSNGAASSIAPECLGRLGAKIIAIHASPTGININQDSGSEHARKHPIVMHKLIQEYSADFGIAFDGDADRVVFVDDAGNLIDGDHILGILAEYFDRHQELLGRTIVSTKMRNQGLVNYLQSNKIRFIETKVGDKYVTEKLVNLSYNHGSSGKFGVGGEQAGHVILYDKDHVTGDGIRTALFVIRAFLEADIKSFSEMAWRIKKTPQVIASAKVASKPDLDRIEELSLLQTQLEREGLGITRMELRYSGTEPLFRVMIESDHSTDEQLLADIAWRLCRVVQEASGMDTAGHDQIEILNVTRGGIIKPNSLSII